MVLEILIGINSFTKTDKKFYAPSLKLLLSLFFFLSLFLSFFFPPFFLLYLLLFHFPVPLRYSCLSFSKFFALEAMNLAVQLFPITFSTVNRVCSDRNTSISPRLVGRDKATKRMRKKRQSLRKKRRGRKEAEEKQRSKRRKKRTLLLSVHLRNLRQWMDKIFWSFSRLTIYINFSL